MKFMKKWDVLRIRKEGAGMTVELIQCIVDTLQSVGIILLALAVLELYRIVR